MAWDLKGEQLETLTDILHHEKYNVTGLKKFTKESEDVCESLETYLVEANRTHEEEENTVRNFKKVHDVKLNWWETQPCNCIWSNWGSWSSCTNTCGEGDDAGTRCKERQITQQPINGGTCQGSQMECEKCNEQCCRTFRNFVLFSLLSCCIFRACWFNS